MSRAACILVLLLVPLLGMRSAWATPDIQGIWATFNDEGKPTGFVRIFQRGDAYFGVVDHGLPGDSPDKRCDACRGALAGHRMIGLEIISNVTHHDNEYSGGQILDPFNGKEYNVVLKPSADGETLTVRGFIGIPLFGRTQVWKKVQ